MSVGEQFTWHLFYFVSADPNMTCPADNPCEQLCGVEIRSSDEINGVGSGFEDNSTSRIVCSCFSGFSGSDNCTGMCEHAIM